MALPVTHCPPRTIGESASHRHDTTTTERRDDRLPALADRERRAVVSYLRDATSESASVSTLADGFATPEASSPDDVAKRLRHRTSPRLDEIGVLEFDARSGTVAYGGQQDLEALLDAVEAL